MSRLTLYHYTCVHSSLKIMSSDFVLQPNHEHPIPLVWLTDMTTPVRDALGLTSQILSCDRIACRFRVAQAGMDLVMPWWQWRRANPDPMIARWAQEWESAPGARPMHWWVSDKPIRVIPE